MKGIRHPFTRALYEQDDDGNVLVSQDGHSQVASRPRAGGSKAHCARPIRSCVVGSPVRSSSAIAWPGPARLASGSHKSAYTS